VIIGETVEVKWSFDFSEKRPGRIRISSADMNPIKINLDNKIV
jgi:hypothetical protein